MQDANCPPWALSALPTRMPQRDHSASPRPVCPGSTCHRHVSPAPATPLRGGQSAPLRSSQQHSDVAWLPTHFPLRLTRRFSSASSSWHRSDTAHRRGDPRTPPAVSLYLLPGFEVQENTHSNSGVYCAFASLATPKNAWLRYRSPATPCLTGARHRDIQTVLGVFRGVFPRHKAPNM